MKPNDKAYKEFMRVYNKTHVSLEAQIMASLNAAYAAQFQSEDYAGLVTKLKDDYGCNATDDDCIAAADALEALLAERDALKAELAARKEWPQARAEMLEELAKVRAERDALLARLSPVDDKALVEIAADAINDRSKNIARAVAAAFAGLRAHIEAAEREQCAKAVEKVAEKINVAHHERPEWEDGYLQGVHDAAAAIRSGK